MVSKKVRTIVSKTEKLCFTTFVSFSNSSIGKYILIRTPPKLEIKFKVVGRENKIIAPVKLIFSTADIRIELIKINGSQIVKFKNAFADKSFFSLIGLVFNIQNCFPSRETLQQEICEALIIAQSIIAKIA